VKAATNQDGWQVDDGEVDCSPCSGLD